MRIFGGISPDRIAEALGISPTQAKRDVAFARAWLTGQIVERSGDRAPRAEPEPGT
jgi:ECF sigma factor